MQKNFPTSPLKGDWGTKTALLTAQKSAAIMQGKRTATATAAQRTADGAKFPGGEIVRNIEADRLQILFDEKPDEETRAALKQNGFRWSPRYSAWQRQLTPNAEAAARRALGLTE